LENLQITYCEHRGCRDAGEAVEERGDAVKELRVMVTYKNKKWLSVMFVSVHQQC